MHLVAENLVVSRGGRVILDHVSFRVAAGEVLVLTGPNGAGKTTLLRSIAGFIRPDSGSVRLAGTAPGQAAGEDPSVQELCHFVGHRDGLKSALTVEENAAFWAEYLGGARPGSAARIREALAHFDIAHLAPIRTAYLSAGQKRRVGLTRLLLAERPLWLLDEPTASLDTASQQALARLVNAHLAAGGLAVAATHLPLGFERAREFAIRPTMVAA